MVVKTVLKNVLFCKKCRKHPNSSSFATARKLKQHTKTVTKHQHNMRSVTFNDKTKVFIVNTTPDDIDEFNKKWSSLFMRRRIMRHKKMRARPLPERIYEYKKVMRLRRARKAKVQLANLMLKNK